MIKELKKIYGIYNGEDHKSKEIKSNPNNSELISQPDLASQLGISVDTLNNYKLLTEMIPELEDLVDTGIVTKTTALAIMQKRNNSHCQMCLSLIIRFLQNIELVNNSQDLQKYRNRIIRF